MPRGRGACLRDTLGGTGSLGPFLLSLALAGTLTSALPPHVSSQTQEEPVPLEYQVKAAFLVRFISFVEWPPEVLLPEQAVTIGVLGDTPLTEALTAIEGDKVSGHELRVKQSSSLRELGSCHILFISPSAEQRLHEILGRLSGSATLTVSEVKGFAQAGGMINFFLDDRKVRFEINDSAAERESMKISSKLLRLARRVREKG